jgi:aryl-alcohol dehydrogenase-like predicted oxidoreductase
MRVAPLAFGTAPMGHAFYRPEPFEEVINTAIDAGINYMDTARLYDVAEERLAPILARRRKEVFLVTKTWANTRDDALRSLEKSLSLMGVDSVDLCHMHNVSQYTREEALGKGGLLEGLQEARKRGWIKHIGCTGHMQPDRFIPVIETGEIEVLMVAMNFADCYTYNFEEKVLPTARKHGCAIVCMKVFGGVTGGWDGYKKRRPGRLAGREHHQDAVDYALSIPDVSTCVIGLRTLEELRLAIEAVRNHRPLAGKRREVVMAKGKKLAAEWGDHFGPVT